MKVYVIMGNDSPDAVKASEKEAEEYVDQKIKEGKKRPGGIPVIHWRYYEFEMSLPQL